jgi:hypothetical protein
MEAAALGTLDNLELFKDGTLDQLEALTAGVFDGASIYNTFEPHPMSLLSLKGLACPVSVLPSIVFLCPMVLPIPPSPLLSDYLSLRQLSFRHAIAFEAGLLDIIDVLSTDFSVGIQAVIQNAKDNIITTVSTLSDTINLVDTKYVVCLAVCGNSVARVPRSCRAFLLSRCDKTSSYPAKHCSSLPPSLVSRASSLKPVRSTQALLSSTMALRCSPMVQQYCKTTAM